MGVGSFVTLDADCAYGGEDTEGLPQLLVQTGSAHLFANDSVGGPQYLEPILGYLTDDPNRQPRAWERLTPHDLIRESQLLAITMCVNEEVLGEAT